MIMIKLRAMMLPGLMLLGVFAASSAYADCSAVSTTLNAVSGCSFAAGNTGAWTDYTVPPDGKTYLWTLRTVSTDPLATASLEAPNEVFGVGTYQDAHFDPSLNQWVDTYAYGQPADVAYTWQEHVAPHLTWILTSAEAPFDDCGNDPSFVGLCALAQSNVWGNSPWLGVDSATGATVYFSSSLYTGQPPWTVPEPGVWATMILGLAAAGASLRRRRTRGGSTEPAPRSV